MTLLVVVATASAQNLPERMNPTARAHLERGLRHYNVQQYAEAIAEFKSGYLADPVPELLYALAQAERLRGNCKDAILAYESFLRTQPDERRATPARKNLERCRAAVRAQPVTSGPTPASQPVRSSADAAQLPPAAPAPPPAPSRRTDILAGALCVGGAVALMAGGLIWAGGRSDIEAANAARDYGTFDSRASGAEVRQTVGVAVTILGGGLLALGVVRYLVLRAVRRVEVGGAAGPRGGLMLVGGRF
jgi:tetratricopeptide (TPR) repeat protein